MIRRQSTSARPAAVSARVDGGVRGALRHLGCCDPTIAIELLFRRFRRPARSLAACSVSSRDFYPSPPTTLLQGSLHAGFLSDDDTAWALRRFIGASLLHRYSSASPPRSVTPADALLGREWTKHNRGFWRGDKNGDVPAAPQQRNPSPGLRPRPKATLSRKGRGLARRVTPP